MGKGWTALTKCVVERQFAGDDFSRPFAARDYLARDRDSETAVWHAGSQRLQHSGFRHCRTGPANRETGYRRKSVALRTSPTAPRLMWLFGLLFVVMGVFFVVGRFFVKAARKRRTRYFLTDRRAIVVDPSGVHNINLDVGRESSRLAATARTSMFGNDLGPLAAMPGMASLRTYANTGLDFFAAAGPGLPIAFYDVADVDGLEHALDDSARAE